MAEVGISRQDFEATLARSNPSCRWGQQGRRLGMGSAARWQARGPTTSGCAGRLHHHVTQKLSPWCSAHMHPARSAADVERHASFAAAHGCT